MWAERYEAVRADINAEDRRQRRRNDLVDRCHLSQLEKHGSILTWSHSLICSLQMRTILIFIVSLASTLSIGVLDQQEEEDLGKSINASIEFVSTCFLSVSLFICSSMQIVRFDSQTNSRDFLRIASSDVRCSSDLDNRISSSLIVHHVGKACFTFRQYPFSTAKGSANTHTHR